MATKILTFSGFRTMAAWFISVINNLWSSAASTFITSIAQSTRNKFDEVQVGLNENVEVLAPAFAWGNTPYTGAASWEFTEEQRYRLGSYIDIDLRQTIDGETNPDYGDIDVPIYDDGWSDAPEGYTRFSTPSLITDTAGNQHVVYPVWGWLADGGYAFRPATIQFRHNASYKGGDLDMHEMKDITLSGSASAAQTITGLHTTQEVKVGQFGQFETTVNGVTKPWPCIVTAVTEPAQEGDPYTFSLLSVSEASGTVANLKLYQAV